jgi:hypothetical protein
VFQPARHDGALALLAGRGLEQFDHLDLEGLGPGATTFETWRSPRCGHDNADREP